MTFDQNSAALAAKETLRANAALARASRLGGDVSDAREDVVYCNVMSSLARVLAKHDKATQARVVSRLAEQIS